jgi:hypothetical protein
VDATVLGAVTVGLIGHHYKWDVPPSVAVGGFLSLDGDFGPLMGVTREHVRSSERAGVQMLLLAAETPVKGLSPDEDLPIVHHVRVIFDLSAAVWR